MASGDTKTEALLNVLGHGGSIEGITGSGNTKTQDYLVDAIGRLQGIQDEVEELKNNPDVVDIVDTYADLQAYDTQHLSNNDIIRVLEDETHSGNSTYYRFTKNPDTWTFIGEISGGGGGEAGAAKVLTSADYNWNSVAGDATTTPFDSIALWLLEPGFYTVQDTTLTVKESASVNANSSYNNFIIGVGTNNFNVKIAQIISFGSYSGTNNAGSAPNVKFRFTAVNSGGSNIQGEFLNNRTIFSTPGDHTSGLMSQNAITSMVFADPNTQKKIKIGDSSSNIGNENVVIGNSARAQNRVNNSVFVGSKTDSNNDLSGVVCLGYGAKATRTGEVNVGAGGYTGSGYNTTSYRVIGGVHDPVDNHDAATKGYVDAHAGGSSIAYAKSSEFVDYGNVTLYKDSSFTSAYNNGEIYDIMASGGDLSIIVKAVNESSSDYRQVFKPVGGNHPTTRSDAAMDDTGMAIYIYNGETNKHGGLIGYDGLTASANFTLTYS